jgi:hypothetical protein
MISFNSMELEKIHAQTNRLSSEYNQMESQWKMLQRALSQVNRDPKLASEEAQLEIILSHQTELTQITSDNSFKKGHGYSDYLIALAQQHIADIWLTRINIHNNGTHFSIEGKSNDAVTLPEYLDRLSMEPVLAGKHLETLRMKRDYSDSKNHAPMIFTAATAPD